MSSWALLLTLSLAVKAQPLVQSYHTTKTPGLQGRRILVYAAPGSGGSLLALILAQRKDSIAFPNLHVEPPTPNDLADVPGTSDIIVTVRLGSQNNSLASVIDRFNPHIRILLLRHPSTMSMIMGPDDRKQHSQFEGRMSDRKQRDVLMVRRRVLQIAEWTWTMREWDAVLLFEELLFNPSITRQKLRGAGFSDQALHLIDRMSRSKRDIERFNSKHCRWSRTQRHPSKRARSTLLRDPGWDFGGVSNTPSQHLKRLRDLFPQKTPDSPAVAAAVRYAPTLSLYYKTHHPELEDSDASATSSTTSKSPSPPFSTSGSSNRAWLGAIQRLHTLLDDRAAMLVGEDASLGPVGRAKRENLRERWIVLTLASTTWVKSGVVINWMAALNRVHIDSFIVLSLDLPSHEALLAVGAPSFYHETHLIPYGSGSASTNEKAVVQKDAKPMSQHLKEGYRTGRASVLLYKWKVVNAILKRGVSVLLSDADSVVLRDFRPLIEEATSAGAHIIIGRGVTKKRLLRTPFALFRSCIEVLHLVPRIVSSIAVTADDELALNRILSGVIGWQEPPLRPDTRDRFIEGKATRSLLFKVSDTGIGNSEISPSKSVEAPVLPIRGALDPPLRALLVPNRLLRIYDCKEGHPLETALVMHCSDRDFAKSFGATNTRLRQRREGRHQILSPLSKTDTMEELEWPTDEEFHNEQLGGPPLTSLDALSGVRKATHSLRMTRHGQLVEVPERPRDSTPVQFSERAALLNALRSRSSTSIKSLRSSSESETSIDAAEVARLKLRDVMLWLLEPEWRQQYDLIQTRVNRHTVRHVYESKPQSTQRFPTPVRMNHLENRQWLSDITTSAYFSDLRTNEFVGNEHNKERGIQQNTRAAKRQARNTKLEINPLISSHNIKRRCKKAAKTGNILCGLGDTDT